jgi:hypothetical protein
MCLCTYVLMCLCTYVLKYLCAYVLMYLCTYVLMCLCAYVLMYLCAYVLMCLCAYVLMCLCAYLGVLLLGRLLEPLPRQVYVGIHPPKAPVVFLSQPRLRIGITVIGLCLMVLVHDVCLPIVALRFASGYNQAYFFQQSDSTVGIWYKRHKCCMKICSKDTI